MELNAPKVFKDAEGVAEKPNSSEGSGVPTSKGVDTEVQTMNTEQGGSAPNLSNERQPEKHYISSVIIFLNSSPMIIFRKVMGV